MQAKLLEHNVRFGDPECQCLMRRLESDLLEMLLAASEGQLAAIEPEWSPEAALTVVLAAQGYPGSYLKNTVIKGLDNVSRAKASFQTTCNWKLPHTFLLAAPICQVKLHVKVPGRNWRMQVDIDMARKW